jgi:hypothetical protein
MLHISLDGMNWNGNTFVTAKWTKPYVLPFNSGFITTVFVKNPTEKEPYKQDRILIFIDSSGNVSKVDTGKYVFYEVGLSKGKSAFFGRYKDESILKRHSGPEGAYISIGYNWDICILSEDNQKLIPINKDLNFRSKDKTVNKLSFCKNKVIVSGSSLRKKQSFYLINQIFGDVQVKPREVLIGNVENGFPVEHKLLEIGKEIADCTIANDGLTACLLLLNKQKQFDQLAIIDL